MNNELPPSPGVDVELDDFPDKARTEDETYPSSPDGISKEQRLAFLIATLRSNELRGIARQTNRESRDV
jgi:hypothetical protein